jgi:Fe-S cluster biogenesis protein NfuA
MRTVAGFAARFAASFYAHFASHFMLKILSLFRNFMIFPATKFLSHNTHSADGATLMNTANTATPAKIETNVETSIEAGIEAIIARDIRPYIERDGGSIAFKEFRDGVVFVELSGACRSCSAHSITLKAGVERALRRAFREVRSVQAWQG